MVDLGSSPPSNAYLTAETLREPEKWFPLRAVVCENCWLVQTDFCSGSAELFDADYAYFSSFSTSWLNHAEAYVTVMVDRLKLGNESLVVEIASNDGYLLQFVKKRGIGCLGIEPTASTARASREKGIETIEEFFGVETAIRLAAEGRRADLLVANNVLAHVPDINDFVKGFAILLKADGVATFEFPHLLNLIHDNQFDTIYHEHFSYLSLNTVKQIFQTCGLSVFDVEKHTTHGGSLRVFAQRSDSGVRESTPRLRNLLMEELTAGLQNRDSYAEFQYKAEQIKDVFLSFLIETRRSGKSIAAYGAAAKGNTLINFAGIRTDLIPFVVDRNPAKQGKFLPGSRIPIVGESFLTDSKPDYIVILPWNLRDEIVAQLDYTQAWGSKFVTAIPRLQIHTI